MEKVAPLGGVYQAGTLAGNPVAVRAGIYTLTRLKEEMPYDRLRARLERLGTALSQVARDEGVAYTVNSVTSMFTGFFNDRDVVDYATAVSSDRRLYAVFFKAMLDEGIFFAPSQYEAAFLTLAHDDGVVEKTVETCRRVFGRIKHLS
jgi:glutamate-1-semialdehyde 2,1-aminomutase